MKMRKRITHSGIKPESIYYCIKCNSYHKVSSKIGKEHFGKYFGWWKYYLYNKKKKNKSKIQYTWIGTLILLFLGALVAPGAALYDSFEYHQDDDLSDLWEDISGAVSIVEHPYENYTKALKLHTYQVGGDDPAIIQNKYYEESNYWSFVLLDYGLYNCAYHSLTINFYNDTGIQLFSNDMESIFSNYHNKDLYEFIWQNEKIYLRINGTNYGSLGDCSEVPSKIKINVVGYWGGDTLYHRVIIDDFRNYYTEGFVDIGADRCNAGGDPLDCYNHSLTVSELYDIGVPDYNVSVSYAIPTIDKANEYDPYEYKIQIKHISTGTITKSEVIKEADNSTAKPCGILVYNRTEILTDYGVYYFILQKGDAEFGLDYLIYRNNLISGASWVNIKKDLYVLSETMQIEYDIGDYDAVNYAYYIKIYDMDTWTSQDSWTLTSITGTKEWNIPSDTTTGTYFAILSRETKSTGITVDIAMDSTSITKNLLIEGITYNTETDLVLNSVNVSYKQGSIYYNTTSDASTGVYNLSGLLVDVSTSVNATKTNYTHNDFSFTPLLSKSFNINIFMLPDINHISYHNTSIGGLVQSYPFYQNISSATVNIGNATWSDSTIANSAGYYIFENLTNGTYSINATYEGYLASDNEEIETNNGGFLYHYILLQPQFILTIKAKDASTHSTIGDFTSIVNDESKTTTNGSINFTVDYGIHKVEVISSGYYSSLSYVYMDENTEEIIYLTSIEKDITSGVYYAPHSVEFLLQNYYGSAISDVEITAYGVQTTMGVWGWLTSMLGFTNETAAAIRNTTMNGTTDSTGSLSFLMIETIKYKITFVKTSEGINETMYFYPKESQYLIMLTPTIKPMMIDYVNWNLSVEEISGEPNNRSLNLTYTDAMSKTSQICFFVRDENNTELYSTCIFADNNLVDTGRKVAKSSGATYYWGFNCTHDTFGDISGTKAVTFKSRLIDLQINDIYYPWIAIALLVLISSLFSAVTVKFGYVVLPMLSAFFVYIGFLEIPTTLITVIVILGILLFMGKKERESGL